MQFVTNTKQDNDVTYRTNEVYTENDTKLYWPIKSSSNYEKNKQDNDVTDYTNTVYLENQNELSCLIRPGAIYDENDTWQ